MDTAVVETPELATSLEDIRRTPLDRMFVADVNDVIRRILESGPQDVPGVPVAAFSSAI